MENRHKDGCNCNECNGHCTCVHCGFRILLKLIFGIIIFVVALVLAFRGVPVLLGVAAGTMQMSALWAVISSFIALAIVAWIISWLLHWPWDHRHWGRDAHGGGRAERILRRRYARGDISEAQFKRMTKTLNEEKK